MNLKGYPINFWLICFALFFFMVSFNILLPEMNEFISSLGGENLKGLVITMFTISAAGSRPFSGKLSDTIGRKKVMLIGLIIAFIVTLLYPISGLITFLFLRFLHGFSAGFLPTGATALVTDLLPPSKRGRGMGMWGIFSAIGIGAGQLFSGKIVQLWGMDGLFFVASIFVLFTSILVLMVSETLPDPVSFRPSLLKIKWEDVIEPSVIPAFIVMFCSAISTGIVFVITPEVSGYLEIENKGYFFGYYMVATIVIRFFTSSVSDRIGRRKSIAIGMFFMFLSMTLLAFSFEPIAYTIGAILFGIATGISGPAIFAWTADLSPVKRRGVGAGTLFIALEIGIMFGASSTLLTYHNSFEQIKYVFLTGSLFALFSVFYLIWHLKKNSHDSLPEQEFDEDAH